MLLIEFRAIGAIIVQIDFRKIKRSVDLVKLVRGYGIELTKKGAEWQGKCPFHEDETPSLSISQEKGLFNCFGCGESGNAIQFVAKIEGISEFESAKKLQSNNFNARKVPQKKVLLSQNLPSLTDRVVEIKFFKEIVKYYHESLFYKVQRGLYYLDCRNLADTKTLKHFQVGFVDGTMPKVMNETQRTLARKLGFINDRGTKKFYNRVVVPIFDESLAPVGLYGRDITGKSEVKHLYLQGGHKAVWNSECAEHNSELIVTESIFDALVIHMHGGKQNVIACYGAGGWTPHHDQLIEKNQIKKIILAFDNDKTGQERGSKLAENLQSKGIEVKQIKWDKDIKDANDYFCQKSDVANERTFSLLL